MRTLILLVAALWPVAYAADAIVPPQRAGIGVTQRHLTLEQVVQLAITANLDVEIERTNVDSADQAITAARGSFDPVLRWMPNLGDGSTPTASLLQGSGGITTQHSVGQTFAFHDQLPWNGLSVDAQFGSSRMTSADPFVSLSPFYVSQFTVGLTQPLLRGRVIDDSRAQVKIRFHNRNGSCSQLDARAIEIASRAQQVYWDLLAARRQVEVQVESATLARIQLERDQRMIAAGTLPQVELSAAEAELERRMDDLYRGTGTITETEDALKLLLARGPEDNLWKDEIVPDDNGAVPPPTVIETSESIQAALHHRPELKQLEENLAATQVEHDRNADLVKPQMNLAVGYTAAGMAGTVKPGLDPFTAVAVPVYQRVDALSSSAGLPALAVPQTGTFPGSVVGGYGSSFSSLFGGRYQTVTAGITFDFTVRNRTAQANLASTAVAQKRLELMRTRAEQTITAQVRDALQALETGRQRMRAAAAAERAAKDKLDSETRLFSGGETTNFLVLTRQNEYAEVRRRRVEAEAAFNKSVAQYEAATGTTLSSRGLSDECGK